MLIINFLEAARRHYSDAEFLYTHQRQANSGQLFGFAAECGLKALLVQHGLPIEANGDIQRKPATGFREHLPKLAGLMNNLDTIPDGRKATRYVAMLPNLTRFSDWNIDHRYYATNALPSASLPGWQQAAREIMQALDNIDIDDVSR